MSPRAWTTRQMAPYHRISVRAVSSVFLVAALGLWLATPVYGQADAPQWRAFIVDTFNTRLGTPEDVALAVERAASAHANTLLVQVRRRGDAFYLDTQEPMPEATAIAPGFDPLGDLLVRAREAGLEVHALLTLGPVWNAATPPADGRHVFRRHGHDGARLVEGPENWLTRTLVPDGTGTSNDGYRFGNDFWLDFGHPDAASYVVDVVTRLVARYPLDGVHLDALHYPPVPLDSASIGYNAVSVARFQRRTGQAGTPAAEDPRWSDWRREQITALTRRIAVAAQAIRPALVVTVGGVADGAAPGDVRGTTPFARRFQDWFAWTNDGSVDAVVPEVYRPEHDVRLAAEFTDWTGWLQATARARPVIVGIGAYLNAAEGMMRQARAGAAAAGPQGGVALFSLAAINAPVIANPHSLPAGRDTPQRPFEDIASILRTGRTTSGQVVDPTMPPLFAVQVPRPGLPWKDVVGHVLGVVEDQDGLPSDGMALHLEAGDRRGGPADVVSDGSGVFAVPAVTPGTYRLRVVAPDGSTYISTCSVEVSARAVAHVRLQVDATRPAIATCQ